MSSSKCNQLFSCQKCTYSEPAVDIQSDSLNFHISSIQEINQIYQQKFKKTKWKMTKCTAINLFLWSQTTFFTSVPITSDT